jgi:hypothetical protein
MAVGSRRAGVVVVQVVHVDADVHDVDEDVDVDGGILRWERAT